MDGRVKPAMTKRGNVFSLSKTGIWTLDYEVGPWRRVLMVGAGLAGAGVAMTQSSAAPWKLVVLPLIPCLALMGYWVASDAPTTVTFDLGQHRVNVESRRPW